MAHDWQIDFEQALGETFCDFVCPPVPFEDASPHECCEVIWDAIASERQALTPSVLVCLEDRQISNLAQSFGEYFECDAPTEAKIKAAIAHLLVRWPVGSLGEAKQ